ncbi:MAG TPA: SAM-dependent methyltransferase [Thermoplasmata archaeon]|nr:SAM-dependent methyltransferase [Thermoplasmata archaeon]
MNRVPESPDETDADFSPELRRRLADEATADRLRFDRYVDLVMQAEGVGYYSRPDLVLGRRGDFYTAPHVTSLFGSTLARRVELSWQRAGRPAHWRVLEIGGGDGTLAVDLALALTHRMPAEVGLEYVIVERSASLRSRMLERLRSTPLRAGFEIYALPTLGADGPFRGVVVANELFDALPFRRFTFRAGTWNEWYVHVGQNLEPMLAPVDGIALLPEAAEEGTVFELTTDARGILRAVADHLLDGVMIALDFGEEETDLLRRREGTVVALRAHHPVANPLAFPGTSDLSTFVNFTRLRRWAAESGLVERAYRSQAEALGEWGIEAELAERTASVSAEEAVRLRLQVKNLLFSFSNFRVVEWTPADVDRL